MHLNVVTDLRKGFKIWKLINKKTLMATTVRARKKFDSSVNYVKNTQNQKQYTSTYISFKCCMVSVLFMCLSIGSVLIALPSPIEPIVMELGEIDLSLIRSNSELRKTEKLFEGELFGPEGFAVDGKGNMYTGINDGRIIKFTDESFVTVLKLGSKECNQQVEEYECGRALGIEINSKEPFVMYICDCYHGIIAFDMQTGIVKSIVNTSLSYPGVPPMKLVNDLAILDNGSIFFTDSSSKFRRKELLFDVIEGRPNGKLLHYNPVDETLSVAISELHFANGITPGPNEEYLLITETTKARILKYYLKGPKSGQVEIFIDNLIGFPDNISPSADGGYWVGFASLRTGIGEVFFRYPFFRNLFVKLGLGRLIAESLPQNGMIVEYYQNGTIKRELFDIGGISVKGVSEILDIGSVLYLGSYNDPYIGKLIL